MAARLRARGPEIQQTILDRLSALEDDRPPRDAEYLKGLRRAVRSGVDYGIELIALGKQDVQLAPLPVVTQARLAARRGISLDLVIRRYLAGKMVLSSFVLEEAAQAGCDDTLLGDALSAYEAAFEQLISLLTDEYRREAQASPTSSEARRFRCIQRLLNGELVDPSCLNYRLDVHHLGLVAQAPEARPLFREMGKELGARVLTIANSDREIWAWIGTTRRIDSAHISSWTQRCWPDSVPLGIGEPAEGLNGWRRSHAQAKAAAGVAAVSPVPTARYRDVALIASASSDPLLLDSIGDLYLKHLTSAGKQGDVLRKTLLVYFEANQHRGLAAAALGVSRQTVANHLKTAEDRLDQPISECSDQLHAALRLEALGYLESA